MLTNKLEVPVKLYKAQFDSFCHSIFNGYKLDRVSLDLDALSFKIQYMNKKGYDLGNLPNDFSDKALELRNTFGEFMREFLFQVIGIPDKCHIEDIIDLMAKDVKIDSIYVNFTMIVISDNMYYLQYLEEKLSVEVFNMFPTEYFRHNTESYNDAIAKAYPELFENRHQDKVGTGADADVFVHNFTFQTTERCSLNCYVAGTKILMADGTEKNIEDINQCDEVMGFQEYRRHGEHIKFSLTTVMSPVIKRKAKVYRITFKRIAYKSKQIVIEVTSKHPMFTWDGRWVKVEDLTEDSILLACVKRYNKYKPELCTIESIEKLDEEQYVYNFETFKHTYIANGILTHNCTYCYQFNKSNSRMEFDTAKKFIDKLLNDEYGYINRYNSPAIIIEFIGGEPLLEIELTRQIYEYFLDRCYELDHPWFTLHRLSICSNGMRYFDKPVQDFFKEYAHNVSFNISIDGNKELHDSCRIQPNGEGSYDIDMAALNHYNKHYTSERNSKMTLAPSNMKYLFDSVVDFIKHDMKIININCVFEEGWNQETAREEYYQLKKLADYIIDNGYESIYIAIFNDRQEDTEEKTNDGSYCGGGGAMLSMKPDGKFYPCIRYMPSSVGPNVRDLSIGNIDDGLDERSNGSEVLKELDSITRRSNSNDICYECPISNDCAYCIALGHTVFGTPKKRTTFTCIQMIAEALANVYYWNRLKLKHPDYNLSVRKNNVPDEWARLVIPEEELQELILLESSATLIDKI